MGGTSYNYASRSLRAQDLGYHTKSVNQIFEQNLKQEAHDSMNPRKTLMLLREARDSDVHPHSLPIIVGLDITGSMGHIPHDLIKDGLPTMVSTVVERGTPDAALLFIGVGDHKADQHPLQIGQFESGDAELDTWLTRLYIEGNGGGNGGESYPLVWYFAAKRTATDAWEKRHTKGFLFTVGDEPFHDNYPANMLKELLQGEESKTFTAKELLKLAQEKWNVFHICLTEEREHTMALSGWRKLMGENAIEVKHYRDVPKVIAQTIIDNLRSQGVSPVVSMETEPSEPTKITL